MTKLPCIKCSGAGSLSEESGLRCDRCEGSGNHKCDNRGCGDDAIGFDDDGDALCEDCLMEWQMREF